MSVQLCNQYHEQLPVDKIHYDFFVCDDMSVKDKDKTFQRCSDKRKKCKDNLCFGYVQVYIGKYPNLTVTTPIMTCPFGIQNQGSNYSLSLQFTDVEEDEYMKSFYEWIQALEFAQMKYLGLTDKDIDSYISQIKYDKKGKYDPNLHVKIPFHYNKFQTDIYSDDHSAVNLFYLQKFAKVQCDIYIDKIWKFNDQYVCKWKVKCIHLL